MSVYSCCLRSMFTGLVLSVAETACNDKRKTRQKENVGSTLLRIKIGYSKESNDQRDQKRIHFTLSNRCEDKLLAVFVFSPFRACSIQF